MCWSRCIWLPSSMMRSKVVAFRRSPSMKRLKWLCWNCVSLDGLGAGGLRGSPGCGVEETIPATRCGYMLALDVDMLRLKMSMPTTSAFLRK